MSDEGGTTMEDTEKDPGPGAPPRLGALRMSPQFEKLVGALAKAQKTMGHASKDAENPHFRSRYADLAAIREAAAPLHEHEIAILQPVQTDGRSVLVTTMLAHSSGQWVAADLEMEAKDASPQSVGSCITYARRYSLAGILAIAADDDDDGNAASGRPDNHSNGNGSPRPAPAAKPGNDPDPTKLMELWDLLGKLKIGAAEAEKLPEAKRQERLKVERLRWISKVTDRAIDEARKLAAAELERCLVTARAQVAALPKEAA